MDDSSIDIVIDRLDRKLLLELQADGRLSVAELARRVHLSPTPCFERVRRLERAGLIKGYVARLDAARVGFPILAFVEVALDRTTPELFDRFREVVKDLTEVLECHMIAGRFGYLLKVRTASLDAFRRFLGDRLASVPGLHQTHTYFALEEVKGNAPLPIRDRMTAPRTRNSSRWPSNRAGS